MKKKSILFLIFALVITTSILLVKKMNQEEYTFSIIKPDAVQRNLISEINSHFTDNDIVVVESKKIKMTKEQAQEFYGEHKGRPFFDSLVEYMTSGPIYVQVLKGENVIKRNREIMGATNPADAAPNTIRAKYAESIDRNSVHGSDSPESAKREISMFFDYDAVTSK